MSKPNNPPNVFNRVYHIPRSIMHLSMEEYCILDTVYELSQIGYSYHPQGWCYAGKGYFAKMLNLNRVSVHRIIKKLINRGFLIKGDAIGNKVVPLRINGEWRSKDIFSERNTSNSYNNIHHRPRIVFELSCAEYCILDTMSQLRLNVDFIWHRSTKRWLAEKTMVPYSTFCRLFDRLIRFGLIELEEQSGKWSGTQYVVCGRFEYATSKENRGRKMTISRDSVDESVWILNVSQ